MHSMKLGASYQSAWTDTVKEFSPTSSTTISPPGDFSPVDLIGIHDGICCNFCNYCCLKPSTFGDHWNATHKDLDVSTKECYHPGSVQTFLYPVHHCYFEVKVPMNYFNDSFEVFMAKEASK